MEKLNSKVRLKESKYNHFFKTDDGCVLAYNAFSNSFAKVTTENFLIIEEILANTEHYTYRTPLQKKLKDDLLRGGFLIDAGLDEFAILKAQHSIGRFANRVLSLTIAPTLACNFKCTYCFERPKADTMPLEVEEALVQFIDKKLQTLKMLNISWFGGEPLLKMDIIERLSSKFVELCEKHGARLNPASIITNGFLLTRDVAARLINAGINSAQITLDGIPEVHDKRRRLAGGKGTFWQIVENIKNMPDSIQLLVRINIDKENADKLEAFYDLWTKEGLSERATFYFGQVRANSPVCADIANQCFTTREYSDLIISLLLKARKYGISNIRYPTLYKAGYCCADNLNGFVVAPSGNIFKCWEEISSDDEAAVANLTNNDSKPHYIMNTVKYLNWDPFSNKECKECNILPICSGGCIFIGLNSLENKECNFWRYNLKAMLQLKYQELNKKKLGG